MNNPNLPDKQKAPTTVGSGDLLGSTLEQLIEAAAKHLPDDWEIRIEVQREYGEVIVTRPDGTEVPMQDGESDIREQFKNAGLLIRDEIMADTVLPNDPN